MKLLRCIFPSPIRLTGSAIITSIDINPGLPDCGKYSIELKPELHAVNITVLQGALAGKVFGVPMSSCTWEYAPAEKPPTKK